MLVRRSTALLQFLVTVVIVLSPVLHLNAGIPPLPDYVPNTDTFTLLPPEIIMLTDLLNDDDYALTVPFVAVVLYAVFVEPPTLREVSLSIIQLPLPIATPLLRILVVPLLEPAFVGVSLTLLSPLMFALRVP